ncbi:MAG: zinc-dependent peptidase [Bacteroidetes bacterium]|nr:zinc-dependent peptidase [Bacteroidota bacterium]
MPSRIFAAPFLVGTFICLYLAWEVDSTYAKYMIPQVILLALIYILSPQINWWWYKRYPPDLAEPIRQLFQRCFPFYMNLSTEEKKRFRQRVFLFNTTHEYMPQGMENVPEDVKAVVGASAVRLTLQKEKFVCPKFERIVIYPHPFPSPQYKEDWHASEIFEEDGVLLFSAEQLMKGFMESDKYYQTGLHEFAKVFVICHPEFTFPKFREDIWSKLEKISGFSFESISNWIGLPEIDPLPVSIHHFFTSPQRFKLFLPEVFEQYQKIFATENP